ncbi:MAG TPA: M48 family metalloprotease, partial [Allocoleopsis sp.]
MTSHNLNQDQQSETESGWTQAPRAKNWGKLKPVKYINLIIATIVTISSLYWLINFIVRWTMSIINDILVKLPFVEPLQILYRDPTNVIRFILALILLFSPWLLDKILVVNYGLSKFSVEELSNKYPESERLIKRFCQQQNLPLPKLGILPTSLPVIFTYGNVQTNAKIVVSQGLLSQLEDDEIATLYGAELAHIKNWNFVLMSVMMVILQFPYLIYVKTAELGDKLYQKKAEIKEQKKRFILTVFWLIIFITCQIGYSLYWVLKLPCLYLGRIRVFYSDRNGVETTGNPNGLTRSLLKIVQGISANIKQEKATSYLLESFDLILPVGYKQSITLGCFSPAHFSDILTWDCQNKYRALLSLNYTHPPLGDRFTLINSYANYWKLTTEIDLPVKKPVMAIAKEWFLLIINNSKELPIFPSTIIYGIINGTSLRLILWSIGKIGDWLNIWQIIWLSQKSMLMSCILITFAISLILQINAYFPDIKNYNSWQESALPELLIDSTINPASSQTVIFRGKLLGRKGLNNLFGQDLILETTSGLIKLHFFSRLGILGNLILGKMKPADFMGREITVYGWFRRGINPWIDVEILRTQTGKKIIANYPI